ncbi:MAG: tRNA adenosine(34) deaminase TadA [Gemmatimonadales bacterium]
MRSRCSSWKGSTARATPFTSRWKGIISPSAPSPSDADVAGIRLALDLARQAREKSEIPVGAVVMRGEVVISSAHNETVARRDPTAHAELLALQRAIAAEQSDRLPGATLYVTLEPCAQCAGAAVLTKIERVVFGAWDERAGMSGSVHDLLRHPSLNHRAAVTGGVLESECGDLLREFFAEKRR